MSHVEKILDSHEKLSEEFSNEIDKKSLELTKKYSSRGKEVEEIKMRFNLEFRDLNTYEFSERG